jgi:hypothetical protein
MARPHPGAVAGGRALQTLEDPEHAPAVLGREAAAVVADRQLHAPVGALAPVHHHDQVGAAAVADGVVDQVGEQLAEPHRVAGQHRQAPDPELRSRGWPHSGASDRSKVPQPSSWE